MVNLVRRWKRRPLPPPGTRYVYYALWIMLDRFLGPAIDGSGRFVAAVKIGVTDRPRIRQSALGSGAPGVLALLVCVPGDERMEQEKHRHFAGTRIDDDGEWFHIDFLLADAICEAMGDPKDEDAVAMQRLLRDLGRRLEDQRGPE